MEGDVVKSFSANWSRLHASLSVVLKLFTARWAQLCRHLSAVLKSSDELSATRRAAADVAGRSVNRKDMEDGFKHGGNGLETVVPIKITLFDCFRVASSWLLASYFVSFMTQWHEGEFQTKQEHSSPGYMIELAMRYFAKPQICWLLTFLYVVTVSWLVLDTKTAWFSLVKDYVLTRNNLFCCQSPAGKCPYVFFVCSCLEC